MIGTMLMERTARAGGAGLMLAATLLVSACTTVLSRNPAPESLAGVAAPYGIPSAYLRGWGDALDDARIPYLVERRAEQLRVLLAERQGAADRFDTHALALSGGGPDGAFGAGVLAGWTARGDRPDFSMVTGVSTGAIVALFAYLGPAHDATLREIYTTYKTEDLFTATLFTGLTGGTALTDTRGYRRLIDHYVDETVMRAIAGRYASGRMLLIGTTNLDASRPMIWNIGEIAASGHPRALDLIRDVIQASSAIPAAFPPVLIPVEAGGRRYDEMHVDGGATQQVMMLSPQFQRAALDAALGVRLRQHVYVIINNKLRKPYEPAAPRLGPIAEKALGSLISGSGAGDLYRMFTVAARDEVDLNVAWIPSGIALQASEPFDPAYMAALYEVGYEIGRTGEHWRPWPPGFEPRDCPEPGRAPLIAAFCAAPGTPPRP